MQIPLLFVWILLREYNRENKQTDCASDLKGSAGDGECLRGPKCVGVQAPAFRNLIINSGVGLSINILLRLLLLLQVSPLVYLSIFKKKFHMKVFFSF